MLAVMVLTWPIIHAFCFDHAWVEVRGLPAFVVDIVLMLLISVIIALGLPMVGALLMSALLVAPAVAARQWVKSMSAMMVLAAIIGASGGLVGAYLSATFERVPTGPTIVFLCVMAALISLVIAPRVRTHVRRGPA